ncbi:hypothetical protein MTR67_019917 [Solanum verrucosum]|uniref:Staygreen protein domain-containing protein n=1 Tax=Solanum verrucosum TaxID=315347 RepID=A0AAF0QMC5_SOLVR|nr:hypothetical protein MTR67_019917 [Solanum verrucosum]
MHRGIALAIGVSGQDFIWDANMDRDSNDNNMIFVLFYSNLEGKNPLQELAAEFSYHIFSKELPLVLEAVFYGDSDFFKEHEELMNAESIFILARRSTTV